MPYFDEPSSPPADEGGPSGNLPSIKITDTDSAAAANQSVLDVIRTSINDFCGKISSVYADPNVTVEVNTPDRWMYSLAPLTGAVLTSSGFDGSAMKTPTWAVNVQAATGTPIGDAEVQETTTSDETLSCRLILEGKATDKENESHALPRCHSTAPLIFQ